MEVQAFLHNFTSAFGFSHYNLCSTQWPEQPYDLSTCLCPSLWCIISSHLSRSSIQSPYNDDRVILVSPSLKHLPQDNYPVPLLSIVSLQKYDIYISFPSFLISFSLLSAIQLLLCILINYLLLVYHNQNESFKRQRFSGYSVLCCISIA